MVHYINQRVIMSGRHPQTKHLQEEFKMLTNKVLSVYPIKDLLESLQRSNKAIAIVTLAGFMLSACQADQPREWKAQSCRND